MNTAISLEDMKRDQVDMKQDSINALETTSQNRRVTVIKSFRDVDVNTNREQNIRKKLQKPPYNSYTTARSKQLYKDLDGMYLFWFTYLSNERIRCSGNSNL